MGFLVPASNITDRMEERAWFYLSACFDPVKFSGNFMFRQL